MFKVIKTIAPLYIIFFIIGCGKEDNKTIKKSIQPIQKPLDIYSKLDVRGCNKEAMEIIDLAREIRNAFKSIEELKKQEKTKKEIQRLARNYTRLLSSCFKRHAAKMFIPSECNNLKLMDKKKSELIDLGIQLEQGEKIKLW